MKYTNANTGRLLVLAFSALLAAAPAWAEKPSWAGGGKGDKGGKHEARDDDHGGKGGKHGGSDDDRGEDRGHHDGDHGHSGAGMSVDVRFDDGQRQRVREYYGEQARSGHCPPGLAKKHNGCMPPGLAKKWTVGQPLPRDVIFHDLEPEIVVRLGVPPPNYRFVRVASDILLIAVGTGMVLDAIEDLGNL
jgi:hypothetical protein